MGEWSGETAGLNHPYRSVKDDVNVWLHERKARELNTFSDGLREARGSGVFIIGAGHADKLIAIVNEAPVRSKLRFGSRTCIAPTPLWRLTLPVRADLRLAAVSGYSGGTLPPICMSI